MSFCRWTKKFITFAVRAFLMTFINSKELIFPTYLSAIFFSLSVRFQSLPQNKAKGERKIRSPFAAFLLCEHDTGGTVIFCESITDAVTLFCHETSYVSL